MKVTKKNASKVVKKKMTAEQRFLAKVLAKKKREESKFRAAAKEIFSGSGFTYIISEKKNLLC